MDVKPKRRIVQEPAGSVARNVLVVGSKCAVRSSTCVRGMQPVGSVSSGAAVSVFSSSLVLSFQSGVRRVESAGTASTATSRKKFSIFVAGGVRNFSGSIFGGTTASVIASPPAAGVSLHTSFFIERSGVTHGPPLADQPGVFMR